MIRSLFALLSLVWCGIAAAENPLWIQFEGGHGVGNGKRVVFISGDEEYRSEEGLPQLAKIWSQRHGFQCTVLFAINPKTGEINPDESSNIPGLEALAKADLMVIAARFRALPDDQMKYIVDYVEAGKPVIGMRTATHAFNYPGDSKSAYNITVGLMVVTNSSKALAVKYSAKLGSRIMVIMDRKALAASSLMRRIRLSKASRMVRSGDHQMFMAFACR